MRAPGLTWFRLPLFVWSLYATSIILLLGTPVLAMHLAPDGLERIAGRSAFSIRRSAAIPILFQHLFWFYSHPAVYIMILPGMGVVSEIIPCFSRKNIFRLSLRGVFQRGDRRVSAFWCGGITCSWPANRSMRPWSFRC